MEFKPINMKRKKIDLESIYEEEWILNITTIKKYFYKYNFYQISRQYIIHIGVLQEKKLISIERFNEISRIF